MGVDLGTATVQIAADTSQLGRGIDGAKLLMLGLGAAAAGAAGEAVKMAGDFQAQNVMLVTSAGETLKNLSMISAGVLKTSVDTGTSTTQLEAAMYKIESSGQRGTAALVDLQAAAEGAKLENSNLADVANAEMTVMTDYASAHITAAQAINDLIATVSHGRASIQDMALAMATVLPTASAVGVSLYDTSAALAVMTARGTDAASAATYLRQMLLAMDHPTKAATATLTEIGLTTAQISDEMKKSLPDTLAMIEDHLKAKFPEGSAAYVAALATISGGSRTMQGVLQLTGASLQTFTQDAKDVATAVQTGGSQIDGWAQIQHNFNLQVDRTHASLDAMMIKIGNELMPTVSQLLSQDVDPAIAHFQDWATQTTGLHDAFSTVVQVIGTTITDTETLVSWFSQGGVQAVVLKDALMGVGIALATIKIAAFASSLETLIGTTIPAALVKYGLLTAAVEAETTATEASVTQLTLWTGEAIPATVATDALATAETGVATAGDGIAASFNAMLGPIGLVAGAAWAGKTAWDAYVQSLPAYIQQNPAVTNTPLTPLMPWNIPHPVDDSAAQAARQKKIDDEKASEQTMIQDYQNYQVTLQKNQLISDELRRQQHLSAQNNLSNDTKTYYDSMVELAYTKTQAYQRDETQSYDMVTAYQNGYYKNSLSDATVFFDNLNEVAYTKTAKGQADYQKQLDYMHQYHVSTLQGMVTDTQIYYDEMQQVAYQKTQSYVRDTYQSDQLLMQYYNDLANLTSSTTQSGPPSPITGNRGTVSHHASGGVIPPGSAGYVAEAGTGGELVYSNPGGGTTVYTGAQSAGMMGGGGQREMHIHNHIYLDGREMTAMLMNRAVKQIRVATGAKI